MSDNNNNINFSDEDILGSFVIDHPENAPIIKVIGVGGGGGNAVNQMYRTGIKDVSFAACNTDKKALDDSPIDRKVQLGQEGLGAGNLPEKGKEKAEESLNDIKRLLSDGTRMTFITAGMGGGTGTGSSPIIAKVAKDMGILTVGIVTIPFVWEGKKKIKQAIQGVEKLKEHVDALLIINNERISKVYPGATLKDGFQYANNILTTAAKSIADIINMHGLINLDFNDVCTILKDGGVALMSTGEASGDQRIKKAIEQALTSPLLNNNDIKKAQKILLNIASNENEDGLRADEMDDIHKFMDNLDNDYVCKWGLSFDNTLGDKVRITILASGFNTKSVIEGGKVDDDEMKKAFDEYYPGLGSTTQTEYQFYIFNTEDLDDDNIISSVENAATSTRSSKELKGITHRQVATSEPTTNTTRTDAKQYDGVTEDGTIKF